MPPEQWVPEDATAAPPAVIVVGSLHYDIMVDAPDRPRKGETIAGRSWAPKFGGKGEIRPSPHAARAFPPPWSALSETTVSAWRS